MNLNTPKIRVVIVADDPLARAGLAAMLDAMDGCVVEGQLSVEEAQPESLEAFTPDAVVWDAGWNAEKTGARFADALESKIPFVVLAQDEDDVGALWTTGARSILSRNADAQSILIALTSVTRGLVTIDERLLARALSRSGEHAPVPNSTRLTPREGDVLWRLGQGMSNKSIAFELGISEHTVKFHVNSIMGKLGAQSRTEAVVLATRSGILPL